MYEVIRESHKLIEENNEDNASENSLEYNDQIVTDQKIFAFRDSLYRDKHSRNQI